MGQGPAALAWAEGSQKRLLRCLVELTVIVLRFPGWTSRPAKYAGGGDTHVEDAFVVRFFLDKGFILFGFAFLIMDHDHTCMF
ncbi:hypothetical protein D3C87_1985900 [compost metagenome]